MKTIKILLLLFITYSSFGQNEPPKIEDVSAGRLPIPNEFKTDASPYTTTERPSLLDKPIIIKVPKEYGLINSKAMVITGMTSYFIAGFFQNMHTIYVIEPEYLEKKFGWKDPKTTQNDATFPFNSFLSPGKNQEHALQAAVDYFVGIGSSAVTINYLFHGEGFKIQGKTTWQKIYYIAAPLVAGRVMMGLGGQAANLYIKNRLAPL